MDKQYSKPEKVPESHRYMITLPKTVDETVRTMVGYYDEFFGIKLTISGVIRIALKELKDRLDREMVKALVESPKESMVEWDTLVALEAKRAKEANYMEGRKV